jgi:hypothetical protein
VLHGRKRRVELPDDITKGLAKGGADDNRDKSYGGRIGFTPFPRQGLLNFGIGAFYGPEQDDVNSNKRWVLDFTWTPMPRFL